MTPPNVLETPKPVSSVMIKRIFGASLGGTTRAGQYGVDWVALRSILPSNFCGGGGSWLPSIVVVASGEPGLTVVCCAIVEFHPNKVPIARAEALVLHRLARMTILRVGGAERHRKCKS